MILDRLRYEVIVNGLRLATEEMGTLSCGARSLR